MALAFPSLDGLNQPFEVAMFHIEHYLAICGPMILIAFGRFGHY